VQDKHIRDGQQLFVGNLSYDLTDQELADAFAEFAGVETATVVKDRETGKPRRFGFVTLLDSADVELAIEKCRDLYLRGRKIRVERANARTIGGAQRVTRMPGTRMGRWNEKWS
jgi:RNA recognition motif-containing protein